MTIWTVQSGEALDYLEKNGTLRNNGFCMDNDYSDAYSWMSKQLSEKTSPAPEGAVYPIWGWIRYGGKPFSSRKYDYEDGMVLIKAEVPDDMILASDFDEWHFVLDNLPHDCMPEAVEALERWFDERKSPIDPRPEYVQQKVEQSWQGIFHDEGDTVQGVCWELKKEWILEVTPLKKPLLRRIRERLARKIQH